MALPSSYLITTGKTGDFLKAIQDAQAPRRFTQKFLEGLGFQSTNDRLFIGLLKTLRFLNDTGEPLPRYHEFLDKTRGGAVLAEALRESYADLFQVNTSAQEMTKADVKNKMKTLSQGEHSETTLERMAATFTALAKIADFEAASQQAGDGKHQDVGGASDENEKDDHDQGDRHNERERRDAGLRDGGLHYNINIHLPESRDPAVYDALFRSLREHLQ